MLLPHLQLAVGVPALWQGWAHPPCLACEKVLPWRAESSVGDNPPGKALAAAPALKTHMQNLSTQLARALGVTRFAVVRGRICLPGTTAAAVRSPVTPAFAALMGDVPRVMLGVVGTVGKGPALLRN